MIKNEIFSITIEENTKIDIKIDLTAAIIFEEKKEKIIEHAEMHLKHAKKEGIEIIYSDKELDLKEERLNRLRVINQVKLALEEDRVIPVFQPIFKTDNDITYEALVRIKEVNEKGETIDLISPFFFLDIIKKTPSYEALTKVMIKKTFEKFENSNNSFSINFSFEDIKNDNIKNYLLNRLLKYKNGNKLIIEILESENINDFHKVNEFIEELRKFKVRIALDDFGSGYANFAYLLQLKPDYIKIDGEIIKNLDKNDDNRKLAKSICGMAQELNIDIIGEFIHSQKVFEISQELGFQGYQGFHLAQPSEKTNYENIYFCNIERYKNFNI